jgi:hypothetical protein
LFEFHYERMVRFILCAFSLHEIVQHKSVELCITLDGAEQTKDLSHLTFGVKVTNPRAIDPLGGSPLSYTEDGVFDNLFRVQSRNYCSIMKSLLGKDSKRAYAEFQDLFKFFDNLMPENEYGCRIMPLVIWSPQDLSSLWKCLNTGSGARKHKESHWCHLCPCTGNKIAFYTIDNTLFFISLYLTLLLISFIILNVIAAKQKAGNDATIGELGMRTRCSDFNRNYMTG